MVYEFGLSGSRLLSASNATFINILRFPLIYTKYTVLRMTSLLCKIKCVGFVVQGRQTNIIRKLKNNIIRIKF